MEGRKKALGSWSMDPQWSEKQISEVAATSSQESMQWFFFPVEIMPVDLFQVFEVTNIIGGRFKETTPVVFNLPAY